jgi:FADH2 O2-dependent halogenase
MGQDIMVESASIVILGAGIAGSMLATILARHGVDVCVLEAGTHPQFAIGESMIPETGAWFRLMALRFAVPELDHLSNFQGTRQHVSAACGVKRAFSFVYHRPGEMPSADEFVQFPTLAPPFGPDTHFFRQDTDAWLLATAVRYGARVHQQCRVDSVQREGDGWLLRAGEREIRCRYLIDGAGFRSPLSQLFGLRDEPCRFRTNSRSLFTHMVGVRPYDACAPAGHGMPYPLAQSTLHHVFDGGWLWVIPFDNHPLSTNGLCSVGLQLDRARHPDDNRPAQQQFDEFLKRFPGVAPQFAEARAVRPWVSTGRLQFSSRQLVGDGYCLLPHAAGFIDPLFSSGLGFTGWVVNALAGELIEASQDGDWSTARFRYIEEWAQKHVDHFDRLVSGAYTSFSDFDMWNAWFRVWALGNYHGCMSVLSRYLRYRETGDRSFLERQSQPPYRGFGSADFAEYVQVLDRCEAALNTFREGRPAREAAQDIYRILESFEFSPAQFRMGDPSHRAVGTFSITQLQRLFWWSRLRAPAHVRKTFYSFGQRVVWKYAWEAAWSELRRSLVGAYGLVRDMSRAHNRDWQ